MAGRRVRDYEPWECSSIERDGNCLFRCLSKLILGSQEYHAKIRGEICRYMVSDGKDVINWYFNEVLTTPLSHHINSTSMSSNGSWAIDAELMQPLHYSRLISMLPTKFIERREA
ncbi:OTU-like cysteine protease family protein [Oopsacas minuta]|uniref:OTU-like cysteine protease family protein n=1 Tax=Oopsacas minuta TaxID=111878 RepID=A0AAV7KDR9_9METZ|nr:OTU-like cysteine protease family protein [Oopsacas minuta]